MKKTLFFIITVVLIASIFAIAQPEEKLSEEQISALREQVP